MEKFNLKMVATGLAMAAMAGGWSMQAQSCCERRFCQSLRTLKGPIAAGYAACCQQEGAARTACLSDLGNRTQQSMSLLVAAQVACQNSDDELLRQIGRDLSDLWKKKIVTQGGVVQNELVGFGRRDWIQMSATLQLPPGQACTPQAVALVGDEAVNPEASGNVAALQQSSTPSVAIMIPAEAANALVSCTYSFPANTPATIRFGEEYSGVVNGSINLAALQTQNNTKLALPTDCEIRAKIAGQTLTLVLDKTSPYNKLEADANGVGYLGMALTIDSKSSFLAGSWYMEETMYFRFPVTVGANWSSVSFNLTQAMQGHQYTPTSDMILNASDEVSNIVIGGDPCADSDGNGIRDGADEVNKAAETASGCAAMAGTSRH